MTVLTAAYLHEIGLAQVQEGSTEASIVLRWPHELAGAQASNGSSMQQRAANVVNSTVESGADSKATLKHEIAQRATDTDDELRQLQQAFRDAYTSALTKFDSLEACFASGMLVPAVCKMLAEEILHDKDFTPAPEHEKEVEVLLKKAVGTAYGAWKKGSGSSEVRVKTQKIKDNPLPWSSIDAYPEWVVNQIENYGSAPPAEQADARRALECALLEKPLVAATIKYDGTCFGKLDTGELVGRKQVLGAGCDEYQKTSTAAAATCNAAAVRCALSKMLAVELDSVCVWGELMCNPNFYGYKEKGLFAKWLGFGVVADLSSAIDSSSSDPTLAICKKLEEQGFAYSISSGGKLRLMLCPALRQLLSDVAGCDVVDYHPQCVALTHAKVVAQAAASLSVGENEGLVLVFTRPDGQSSLRKWKNSAEGATVSTKHAELLRSCQNLCKQLVSAGKLDPRIAEMVETMRSVAEAKTSPSKKGRTAADRAAV